MGEGGGAGSVLVTGAGSPIGRAVSVALGRRGWDLHLTSLNPDHLATTEARLNSDGLVAASSSSLDLSVAEDAAGLVDAWAAKASPGPRAVVHCAFGHVGEDEGLGIAQLDAADIGAFLAASVQTMWNTAWAVARLSLDTRIVFLGADWGVPAHNVLTHGEGVGSELYVSAKYAVTGLSTALDRQAGLRCSLLAPGAVYTETSAGEAVDLDDPLPDVVAPDFVSLTDVASATLMALTSDATARLILLKPAAATYDGVS